MAAAAVLAAVVPKITNPATPITTTPAVTEAAMIVVSVSDVSVGVAVGVSTELTSMACGGSEKGAWVGVLGTYCGSAEERRRVGGGDEGRS